MITATVIEMVAVNHLDPGEQGTVFAFAPIGFEDDLGAAVQFVQLVYISSPYATPYDELSAGGGIAAGK